MNASEYTASAGVGRLTASLRASGCREFDLVLQTLGRLGETIVFSATECVALLSPKTRSEENRLRRGGYYEDGLGFARGQLDDFLQEARFIRRLQFPNRPAQVRHVTFDARFRTPSLEFEHLPGAWKRVMLTTASKTAPEVMVILSLRRNRGRWRRPKAIRVLRGSVSRYVPIEDAWSFDTHRFREVLRELERSA